MTEKLSIKVEISGRTFPLKVSAEEEESVRKAADLVNKKVNSYIDQYSIKDKQIALSMCALELATDLVNNESNKMIEGDSISKKILDIEAILQDI